jgi:nitrogen fixation NifU-like protein
MSTAWEQFEEMVKEKMRENFSETVIEHAMDPKNLGSLEEYNGFADYTGPCGDTMQIWLKVKDGNIDNATFMTDGCGTTVASADMITELARGKSVEEAREIDQKKVLDALGGLPEESEHCALLAERTLKQALDNYNERKSQ